MVLCGQRDQRERGRGPILTEARRHAAAGHRAEGLSGRSAPCASLPLPLALPLQMQVHEHGGRNKTTSVLHHDMMMSLMQQQVYQLAKYGSNGEHAFAPVVGEQAEWCLKVLPWWGQEQGQGEVR